MKKIFLFVLAICLAMPAISYAGSATSRWDLTIGGTVKTTIGWADYKAGDLSGGGTAPRGDYSGYSTADNKYGNWIWGGGETGLIFLVRGPETLGAKTSAFISGDFVGVWGGSTYGSLDLVVATMTFDWTNTSMTLGMGGGPWGMMPVFPGMGWSDWGFGGKGAAPVNTSIQFTHRLTKEFSFKWGISDQNDNNSALNSLGSGGPTTYTRANYPMLTSTLQYSSPACGKVGPWQLTVKASGIWEQEKKTYANTATTVSDKDLNAFYYDLVALVPIIPEKNGNKAGAWYVDGIVYDSQNFGGAGWLGGWGAASSYSRPGLGNYGVPHTWGYLGHTQYYFTDQFSTNLAYYKGMNVVSGPFQTNNPSTVDEEYSYLAQLQYEASPAVKFQLLWNQNHSRYFGWAGAGLKKTGTTNTFKFSAFYYF